MNKEVARMESFGRGGLWGALVFFVIQNLSNLEELKNYIEREFWRVWVNLPNPIYIIILPEVKVY